MIDRATRHYVQDYIDTGSGVAVPFIPDAKPQIRWKHIDGPMLVLRNATLHWLTWRERFRCWLGLDDAFSLERKHAPDFVRRWNERAFIESQIQEMRSMSGISDALLGVRGKS